MNFTPLPSPTSLSIQLGLRCFFLESLFSSDFLFLRHPWPGSHIPRPFLRELPPSRRRLLLSSLPEKSLPHRLLWELLFHQNPLARRPPASQSEQKREILAGQSREYL